MICKCLIVLLSLRIDVVRGETGILNSIKKATHKLFSSNADLPIESQNLSFTTAEDFRIDKVHEITLNPGDALIITCKGFVNGEKVKLYPPNPDYETLQSPDDELVTYDKLNITTPLRDIIRSITPLIDVAEVDNGILKIIYSKKNVVAARDPSSAINVACSGITSDRDTNNKFGIQWIKVTLGMSIPFSYGCGINAEGLFLNLPDSDSMSGKYTHCKIEPSPGMVIGFYCGQGGYMYPPHCLKKTTIGDFAFESETVSTPLDKKIVSMIKITSLNNFNGTLKCRCISKGVKTAEISIIHEPNRDYIFPRRLARSNAIVTSRNITFIRPGNKIHISAPKEGTTLVSMKKKYIAHLVPKEMDLSTNTLALMSKLGTPELVKIHDILGTASSNGLIDSAATGLTIVKSDDSDVENYININIDYPKDSIVVFKDVAASISALLDIEGEDNRIKKISQIYLNIIATDPYTYGCSVNYLNDSGIFRRDKYVVMDNVDGVVGCKVDARRAEVVGFFCPKPARYDPPNCFEQVYLMKDMRNLPQSNLDDNKLVSERLLSSTKIHLADASEYGQSFSGTHIRAAMFNTKHDMMITNDPTDVENNGSGDAGDDTAKFGPSNAVGCRCIDEEGKILAQILLFVPSSKPNHVSWTRDGVSS
ncbi:BMN1-12 [Babesia microti strain RI]|uniref:BMN1-12 n=1 Tax=Babesia microti (strain RI) TaxID=1133968 RepID=A0A0K3AMA5_BABMR|nr:BMN1-12 [Babesia microti strain RI]CTQ40697.1 BMN1-12 [Babesia microti strain RI]|eukprot:XP_012648708.1 BMN1-12 [Babesia microti strain RI]